MAELFYALRLVHIITSLGWIGEVFTVNFVLLPALFKANANDKLMLLNNVFPYIFRLATVLGGTAVLSGLALMLWITQLNLSILVESLHGWLILIGGVMVTALYAFHLFQESRLERSMAANLADAVVHNDKEAIARPLRHLAIFLRAGIVWLIVERIFQGINYLYRVQLPSGTTIQCLQHHNRVYPINTRVTIKINPGYNLAYFVPPPLHND